jgi:carboxyl-terminal processing protease
MPLRNLLVLFVAALVSVACYERASRNRYVAILADAINTVEKAYVEPVDTRVLFEGAMDGMLNKLDPYSSFIPPEDYRNFKESLDQEFGGIGIFVEVNPDTKRLTVMSPKIGTPAFDAGIKPGDTILKVNDQDTLDMTIRDSVKLMRGPVGSEVSLTLLHAGEEEPREYTLKRAKIPIESVYGDTLKKNGVWDFHWEADRRIGYIRIVTFGELTAEELQTALSSFQEESQEIQGLIIDLRGNAGGLLTAAVDTCDMFLDSGVIVSTRGRSGIMKDVKAAAAGVELDRNIPLVILTDGLSASASEIVAACLQDHERAVICGQRTWGKGTVQNLLALEGGKSAMRITTATYWRPSGQNIHKRSEALDTDEWGVSPNSDFEVILTNEEAQKVARARRTRDYTTMRNVESKTQDSGKRVESKTVASPQSSETSVATEQPPTPQVVEDPSSQTEEPFEDPQLKRALTYLQEKIGKAAPSN